MKRIVLFQGDSVTDTERKYDIPTDLGKGYPPLIAAMLQEAGTGETVINRGISGNVTLDLVNRWEEDTLALNPDVLTILIGINDCWRKYDNNMETPIEKIEENYRNILDRTKAANPNIQLILMEPFVLPLPDDRKEWRVTLDPIIHLVRSLAKEYGARLVPLDGILNAAGIERGFETITPDGVHPTPVGHRIIADEWMKVYLSL